MTLFDNEQNGRYETDHIHMLLNENIEYTETGLADDRLYSIFVHEYVHYYQHFGTLFGSQFCKMSNIMFIETLEYLRNADEIRLPFGIWEHRAEIANYRRHSNAIRGSMECSHIVDDIEIDYREIDNAERERKAVKIGVYDYTEDDAYEDGFYFGYYCIIESMAHLIQKMIYPEVEHNQIPYEVVEIICNYSYPEVRDDIRQMVTMCMCALMFDNPGVGFFKVIEYAKGHPDLNGISLYRDFIQTSAVRYKENICSMDFIGQDMLEEYKVALQVMCGCSLEYYNKVIDNFIHDYQLSMCGLLALLHYGDINDRKQFMVFVNIYGLPYIETPELSFLPMNHDTGRPYRDIANIIGFELIFRRLQKLDGDLCPWYRICKITQYEEVSKVDEFCGNEQWKKNCECLMINALKYYNLKDKVFVA